MWYVGLILGVLIWGAVGGVARRMVGGLWLTGSLMVKRMIYAAICLGSVTLATAVLSLQWYEVIIVNILAFGALYAGMTTGYALPGGSQTDGAMNMGRPAGKPLDPIVWSRFAQDFGIMIYHGAYQVALLVVVYEGLLWYTQHMLAMPWFLAMAAVAAGPSYALGWWWKPNIPFLGIIFAPEKGTVDGAPPSELIYGAVKLALVFVEFWRLGT